MAHIFISFIHEEEQVAAALQHLLEKHLVTANTLDDLHSRVFLSSDKWQIYAGEIWLNRIQQELESAKIVILMLSRRSVSRPWVNFEAGAAWNRKPIIPVCFAGLSKDNLPKPYSNIQALNLPDKAYYLVRSVHHHLYEAGVIRGLHGLTPPPFGPDDESFVNLTQEVRNIESQTV